jgi:N-acetylmuramoyl-L-alanine amidase
LTDTTGLLYEAPVRNQCSDRMETIMQRQLINSLIFTMMVIMFFFPVSSSAAPPGAKRVIVIDASHGGADHGVKLSDSVNEKDITLAVATFVEREFVRSGNVQVRLTRTADKDVSLQERIKFIQSVKPDICVSIHVNAGFDKKATGYEIYFPGFKTVAGAKNESKAILKDMTKNKHLNDSVKLAHAISRHLAAVFPKKDRGLREAPLQILEGLSVPAVVIELGFATQSEEREKLMNEATQQNIAKAIAKGIGETF